MGICASCLGLNRHPSQDIDETDPLLDEPNVGYGATGAADQVDEEELQREREELDRITNAATENMIDVHHPDAADFVPSTTGSQRLARAPYDWAELQKKGQDAEEDEEEDEEETAWLESVQAGNMTDVQGMNAGGLVLDVNQLRDEPSAAKKSLKAKVGG